MPEVYLSTFGVRIEVFAIDGKNLDCWNHSKQRSLENRRGVSKKNEKKNGFFVPKVYKVYKMKQFFSQGIRN